MWVVGLTDNLWRDFVSSSIPSWQILTVHAQPFRGAGDLVLCLKVPLDSLFVWASSEGSGETARMAISTKFTWRGPFDLMVGWPRQYLNWPGAVARLEASPLGMQAALSSIPTSGTFFRGDFVMKTFLQPFSLFRWLKKSSCQLLAKECALSTGKLPRRLAQEQCG